VVTGLIAIRRLPAGVGEGNYARIQAVQPDWHGEKHGALSVKWWEFHKREKAKVLAAWGDRRPGRRVLTSLDSLNTVGGSTIGSELFVNFFFLCI